MISEGSIVEFQAVGEHEYHGVGRIWHARKVKDSDGRMVNVYLVAYQPPDQAYGTIILGDGEIVRVIEETPGDREN